MKELLTSRTLLQFLLASANGTKSRLRITFGAAKLANAFHHFATPRIKELSTLLAQRTLPNNPAFHAEATHFWHREHFPTIPHFTQKRSTATFESICRFLAICFVFLAVFFPQLTKHLLILLALRRDDRKERILRANHEPAFARLRSFEQSLID